MIQLNPIRGDVALNIGGTDWVLRPSFAALARIESEVAPLLALARDAAEGRVRLGDMVAVFRQCMIPGQAAQAVPDTETLGAWILEAGMVAVMPPYRDLLQTVLAGVAQSDDQHDGQG